MKSRGTISSAEKKHTCCLFSLRGTSPLFAMVREIYLSSLTRAAAARRNLKFNELQQGIIKCLAFEKEALGSGTSREVRFVYICCCLESVQLLTNYRVLK